MTERTEATSGSWSHPREDGRAGEGDRGEQADESEAAHAGPPHRAGPEERVDRTEVNAIARQDPCRSPSHGPEVCRVTGSQHAQRAGVRQWSTGAVGNGRLQGVGHCRRKWGPQQKPRRPGRWRSPAALRHIRFNAEERLLRTYPAAHGDI